MTARRAGDHPSRRAAHAIDSSHVAERPPWTYFRRGRRTTMPAPMPEHKAPELLRQLEEFTGDARLVGYVKPFDGKSIVVK